VSFTQIKLLNALPLNITICRNDTKGSKPGFNEYIRAHFFNCERQLLQFIRNWHDFWLRPRCTWDLRCCTLRCVISQ